MGIGGFGKRFGDLVLKRSVICLVLAFGAAAGMVGGCSSDEELEPQGIAKGPVLLRVYQGRAAVMWEAQKPGPCKLYYGNAKEFVVSTPEEVSYQIKEKGKETVKAAGYIHKVWIEGLDAGKVYKYRVGGSGIASATHEFRTTPADTDKVRFIVYGDTRTNSATHRRLIELIMKQKDIAFIVHVGDLLTSGNKYEQWGPQHFDVVKGLAESVPIYIAKGNHEGDNDNYEKLLIPPGEENTFGFDYGPLHYFCADNSPKKMDAKKLLARIAGDAKASKAKWKFVTYHVPSLNFGHHWSAWGHPDALPGLSQAGVDFVLSGHSHQYERFKPIQPATGASGSYVTYITTGGGGAPLHEIETTRHHAYAKETNQFCLFEIAGDKLTMDVIDIQGKVIDSLKLTKSSGELNKEYLQTAVPMEDVQSHQEANLSKQH